MLEGGEGVISGGRSERSIESFGVRRFLGDVREEVEEALERGGDWGAFCCDMLESMAAVWRSSW